MPHGNRWMAAVITVAALQLSACAAAPEEESHSSEAAQVEHIEGSDLSRLTLPESAVKRLDIQTTLVRNARPTEVRGGRTRTARKVIPYAAVLYDPQGRTWTYTSPEPRVYVRQPVTVEYIEGDLAILTEGPASGTRAVTVGAAELFGAELGVGH